MLIITAMDSAKYIFDSLYILYYMRVYVYMCAVVNNSILYKVYNTYLITPVDFLEISIYYI